jgi:hypothetical protein
MGIGQGVRDETFSWLLVRKDQRRVFAFGIKFVASMNTIVHFSHKPSNTSSDVQKRSLIACQRSGMRADEVALPTVQMMVA